MGSPLSVHWLCSNWATGSCRSPAGSLVGRWRWLWGGGCWLLFWPACYSFQLNYEVFKGKAISSSFICLIDNAQMFVKWTPFTLNIFSWKRAKILFSFCWFIRSNSFRNEIQNTVKWLSSSLRGTLWVWGKILYQWRINSNCETKWREKTVPIIVATWRIIHLFVICYRLFIPHQ